MVLYKCNRCGYTTKFRANFRYHLNRKFTCESKLSTVSIDTIKEKYGFKNKQINKINDMSSNQTNLSSNVSNFIENVNQQNENVSPQNINVSLNFNKNKCDKCGKIYKHRQSLWKHKKTCKYQLDIPIENKLENCKNQE